MEPGFLDKRYMNYEIMLIDSPRHLSEILIHQIMKYPNFDYDYEYVLDLLNYGAFDINDFINNENPLILASKVGWADVIKDILEQSDVDVNIQDRNGKTPLMFATINGKYDAVVTLLESPKKVNIDIEDRNGDTALTIAGKAEEHAIFREILKYSNVNISEVLMDYCRKDNVKAFTSTLKSYNIDVNTINEDGCTFLITACQNNSEDIFKLLLKYPGININIKDTRLGWNALTWALYLGRKDMVVPLLMNPLVDVNSRGVDGRNTLMVLCTTTRDKMLSLLLNHPELNINATDREGNTALMIAVENDKTTMAFTLLKDRRVKKSAKRTTDNKTAWDLANEKIKRSLPELKP